MKMTTKSIIGRILIGNEEITIGKEISKILDNLDAFEKEFYLEKLKFLYEHKDYLYKSNFHGLYHSEKVMMYALIIGRSRNLDLIDLNIICDAACFHDIGRFNEREEEFHGKRSADLYIETNLFSGIELYKNRENLEILRAITDFHSQDNLRHLNFITVNFYNYEISPNSYPRYEQLAYILKDADALDRKRFGDYEPAGLQVELLKYPESKALAQFAGELNSIYNRLTLVPPELSGLQSNTGACLHSIGRDFYKIPSIIDNGILSRAALANREIQAVNNFNGGNGYYWISVVPTRLFDSNICLNNSASNIFINNGITFVCNNVEIFEPIAAKDYSIAREKSLPCSISGHNDERYVYNEISPNRIVSMVVPKFIGDKSILDAQYLYNNFNSSTIKHKINMFLIFINYPLRVEQIPEFKSLFIEYDKGLLQYKKLPSYLQEEVKNDFVCNMNRLLEPINSLLASIINNHYRTITGRNDLNIYNLAAMTLEATGHLDDIINGEEEYVLTLKK